MYSIAHGLPLAGFEFSSILIVLIFCDGVVYSEVILRRGWTYNEYKDF